MTLSDYQGTYDAAPSGGYAGMIATLNVTDAFSYTVEDSAGAAFGVAMGSGATDGAAAVGGADFLGISVADKTRPENAYSQDEQAAVLRQGVIWVTANTAVTSADPVTYDATGAIGAGLTTTIDKARFEGAAAAGQPVRVHLG